MQEQLKNLVKQKSVSSLKFKDGETIESILREAAEELKDCIYEELAEIYKRKPSEWYTRAFMLSKSLDEMVNFDPKKNTVTIKFNPDMAWHDSWITKKYNSSYKKRAYVPQAIIEGYRVFGHGEYIKGIDFIQNAVDKFNRIKRKGINVNIEMPPYGTWWE